MTRRGIAFDGISGMTETSGDVGYQSFGGGVAISIPIGGQAPMRCVVYTGPRDPGGTLAGVLQAAADSVDVRRLEVTNIKLIAGEPSIFIRLDYETRDPGDRAVGELKAMYYDHPARPLLCLHDELGYHATFARVTGLLAGSLESSRFVSETPLPAEFRVHHIGATPVGYRRRVTIEARNGTSISRSTYCTLVPKSARELVIEDIVSTEISGRQGRLLTAQYARSRRGKLYLEAAVRALGRNEYAVRGERDGRTFLSRFRTKNASGLVGQQGTARSIREAMKRSRSWSLRLEQYQPGITTVAPTEIVYASAKETPHEVSVTGPSLRAHMRVDENGQSQSVETVLGPLRFSEGPFDARSKR